MLFKSYELLEGSKTALRLNWGALIIFLLLLVAAWIVTDRLQMPIKHLAFTADSLLFFGGYLASAALHEGLHGAFFKLFAPERKLHSGVKNGFAHIISPGSRFSKSQFIWIAAAPFVLLTLLGAVTMAFTGVYFWLGLLLITHAASCVGDFYWIWRVGGAPKDVRVEATEQGLALYLPQEK